MKRRSIVPSIALAVVVGLGFAGQLSSGQQRFPESNRKPACGCYVCGLLLAVEFPNKDPKCYGILAADACPQELSLLPAETRAAYCQQIKAKSKGKSLEACQSLRNACETAEVPIAARTMTPDEAAIRENVKQMEAGWNAKSGASFAKPFAADADYVVINGMHITGYDAIEKNHQQIFDTIYKNTTVTLTVKQIKFLRPDVALVHVSGHRDSPQSELIADAIIVMVMTKNDAGWKIASFQNTKVSGPPASSK